MGKHFLQIKLQITTKGLLIYSMSTSFAHLESDIFVELE